MSQTDTDATLTATATILADPSAFATVDDYRHALVWWALQGMSLPTDLEGLRHLDAGLAVAVYGLPAKLDAPHLVRLDDDLHALRLRVARRIAQRQAQLDALQSWIYGPPADQDDDQDASQDAQAPPEDDATRAARLLRAALTLIMQPPQDGPQGGTRTRLQPPRPPMGPTPAGALRQPTTPTQAPALPTRTPEINF